MVALVLGSLDVLLGLLPVVSTASLLLAELGDHVTLVSNLILEGADLVILIGPILLGLHQNGLSVAHLTLELSHLSVGGLNGSLKGFLLRLFALDPIIDLREVLLHISSLVLDPHSLVDDLLHSGTAGLQGKSDLILLGSKAVIDSLNLGAGGKSGVHVSLGLGDLGLVFSLKLAELAALEVGLDRRGRG